MLIHRNQHWLFSVILKKRSKKYDYYFFDNKEQILQDFTLAGNSILKSLILE